MWPFKKKKEQDTPTQMAIKTENALTDNYFMFYNLYSSCIRENNYDKVGAEATSMYRAYNRIEKIETLYENEKTICRNDEEYEFVCASGEFVLEASKLLLDVLKDVCDVKKNKKTVRNMSFNDEYTPQQVEAAKINIDEIAAKLPSYDERHENVKRLKAKRDDLFSKLN